jgi:hypothetical protein
VANAIIYNPHNNAIIIERNAQGTVVNQRNWPSGRRFLAGVMHDVPVSGMPWIKQEDAYDRTILADADFEGENILAVAPRGGSIEITSEVL